MDLHEQLKRAREERAEVWEKANDVLERARAEGGLEGRLLDEYERHDRKMEALGREISALESRLDERIADGLTVGRNGAEGPVRKEARFGQPLPADVSFTALRGGSPTPDFERRFGEYLKGSLTGALPSELRAQSEGTGSEGGYVVPDVLSGQLWDLARNNMVTQQAGVTLVPIGQTDNYTIPKLTADATPTWRAEEAAIGESAITFGAVTLTPNSLAVLVKASREVVMDSAPAVGRAVANSLAAKFAREIDRVVLEGSGSGAQPVGILNESTIAAAATGSIGSPVWADLVTGVQTVRGNNYAPSVIVGNRDWHTLYSQTGTANDHYLDAPKALDGVPILRTTQVSEDLGGGSDSWIAIGDFSEVVLGVRESFGILPLREKYADTGQVAWVAHARVDVAVMNTSAFQILTGTTA